MKKIPYLIIGSLLVPQVGFSQGNDMKADKEKPNRPPLERVEKQREAAEDRAKEALQAAAERLSPRNEYEADNRPKPGKPEKNAERIRKQPDLRTPKSAQDNSRKPEKEADPIVQENDEQQRNERMAEKDALHQENPAVEKRAEKESDPIVQENDEPQRSERMTENQPVPAPPVQKKADPIVTENDEANRAEKPMADSQAELKPAMREPQEKRPATATPAETPRQREMREQRPVATARGSDESQPAREREMQEQRKPGPTTERERPQPKEALTAETRERLMDRGRRDRATDDRKAREIKDDDDAKTLIYSILGGAAAGAITSRLTDNNDRNDRERGRRDFDRDRPHDGRHDPRFDPRDRLPAAQVGRSERERRETVDYLVRRLDGRANPNEAPRSVRRDRDFDDRERRDHERDHRGDWNRDGHDRSRHHHHPHYFNGNRRVVWFSDRRSVPAILIASNNLDQVDLTPAVRSPYRSGYVEDTPREYYEQIPATYQDEDAYALSYEVDPNSAISQDDILFKQGSTNFADAYSYDLVVDMAEAMMAPELSEAQFVIEGHASAEGSYDNNLRLSQERAERIARDLVDMGVSPDRLIPVGYGETEAEFPADAAESRRAMDRRVMVFRKL